MASPLLASIGVKKPILVIDDDTVSCQLMAEILRGHGYDAEWTISPSEALERVSRGGYGLIVSDLVMPEIPGTVLASQIRRLRPGLPILLVTAFPDAMTEDEACDLDIPLLAKPFVPDVLIQRVQDLLSNHPPVEGDKSKS